MVGKKKSGKQTLYFRLRFWEIFKLDTTIFMSLPQQYFLYSESQVRSLSWRGVGGQKFGEGGQVRGSFLHWSPGIETNLPKNLEHALGCRFVIVKNNLVDSGGFTLKKQGISSPTFHHIALIRSGGRSRSIVSVSFQQQQEPCKPMEGFHEVTGAPGTIKSVIVHSAVILVIISIIQEILLR